MSSPSDYEALVDVVLDDDPISKGKTRWDISAGNDSGGDRWTTFDTIQDSLRGPRPWPDWLVTDGAAHDTELGVLKTGKEADVFLLERATADRSCLLAAKRYRSAEHKQFTRDAGYLAGRGVRKTRERRAIANRTALGRELAQQQWAVYEWGTLVAAFTAGLPVPYPVSLDGTEILMEFIGSPDGVAAPRLAQTSPTPALLADLYEQARDVVLRLAASGQAHGDLSPYNLLVAGERLVVIDWPQVVDIVANPDGFGYLQRDCANVCDWFAARGLAVAGDELFAEAVGMV